MDFELTDEQQLIRARPVGTKVPAREYHVNGYLSARPVRGTRWRSRQVASDRAVSGSSAQPCREIDQIPACPGRA